MAEKSSNFTVVGGGGLLGWYTRSMSRDLGLVLVRQVVDINGLTVDCRMSPTGVEVNQAIGFR